MNKLGLFILTSYAALNLPRAMGIILVKRPALSPLKMRRKPQRADRHRSAACLQELVGAGL